MTYKSFTNLDDLFDLLVKRFWIQPPDSLNPLELEEWGKLKQHVIQMRYVNHAGTLEQYRLITWFQVSSTPLSPW